MDDKGGTGPDVAEQARLLAAVRSVRGVAAAELTPGGPGGLGTLRVQLAPGADDVVVAVSVNELLRRQFALSVDADRLEVVEETTGPASAPASGSGNGPGHAAPAPGGVGGPTPQRAATRLAPPSRAGGGPAAGGGPFALTRATFSSAGLGAQVTVTVSDAQGAHTGTTDVGAAPGAVGRAAAAATLAAAQSGFAARAGLDPGQVAVSGEWPVRLEVDRVEVVGHEPDAVATVVISILTRQGLVRQAGAALVGGDARDAIVRAALAAVNRGLELLAGGAGERAGVGAPGWPGPTPA